MQIISNFRYKPPFDFAPTIASTPLPASEFGKNKSDASAIEQSTPRIKTIRDANLQEEVSAPTSSLTLNVLNAASDRGLLDTSPELKHSLKSIEQTWREQKYKDECESRNHEAKGLMQEIRYRETARHNRRIKEEYVFR